MREMTILPLLAFVASMNPVSEGAVRSSNPVPWCRISGAHRLPEEIGAPDALCTAIAEALGAASSNIKAIEVDIISPFQMAAVVMLTDGHRLPTFNVASSDRELSPTAVRMLANSIAAKVASQISR